MNVACVAHEKEIASLKAQLGMGKVTPEAIPSDVMTLLKAAGLALEWTAREAPHHDDADERFPWWRALQAAQMGVLEASRPSEAQTCGERATLSTEDPAWRASVSRPASASEVTVVRAALAPSKDGGT